MELTVFQAQWHARAGLPLQFVERGAGGRILPGGDQADTDHILQGRAIRKRMVSKDGAVLFIVFDYCAGGNVLWELPSIYLLPGSVLADGIKFHLYCAAMVTSCGFISADAIPLFILVANLMMRYLRDIECLQMCSLKDHGRPCHCKPSSYACSCGVRFRPATVAAVGPMVVPTMLEKGYSKSFTLALIATAGSRRRNTAQHSMVIYGVSTSTSISGMFMAGFLPGILIKFT